MHQQKLDEYPMSWYVLLPFINVKNVGMSDMNRKMKCTKEERYWCWQLSGLYTLDTNWPWLSPVSLLDWLQSAARIHQNCTSRFISPLSSVPYFTILRPFKMLLSNHVLLLLYMPTGQLYKKYLIKQHFISISAIFYHFTPFFSRLLKRCCPNMCYYLYLPIGQLYIFFNSYQTAVQESCIKKSLLTKT